MQSMKRDVEDAKMVVEAILRFAGRIFYVDDEEEGGAAEVAVERSDRGTRAEEIWRVIRVM